MWYFEPKTTAYRLDYPSLAEYLNTRDDSSVIKALYKYGKEDLFFFLYFIMDIRPVNHPWLVPKIYEIQDDYNDTLHLWSREHYKSTILTFGFPLWKIVNDPEITIGIFSNTIGLAKDFLRRIKLHCESEEGKRLYAVWPDIFWEKPKTQSPKWSEDDGLLFKRRKTFREMTIEPCGITDGLPTGPHYKLRIYDDIVTEQSVTTAEQINKTKKGFASSHNLCVTDGGEMLAIGTRYDFNDEYSDMIKSGIYKLRFYPGDTEPRMWTNEQLEKKRALMGSYVFSCQISLKPVSEDQQKFDVKDIKWEPRPDPEQFNSYILVDPAGDGKKDHSSYTVMWAIGVDSFGNFHVLDIIRDRLNSEEKWMKLRELVVKCSHLQQIGYEKYSMQADINYIERRKIDTKTYFMTPTPLGGRTNKHDRIKLLIPGFQRGEWYFPKEYWYKDVQGKNRDLVKEFLTDEYIHFPNITYKDMLDCLARIHDQDINIIKPKIYKPKEKEYKLHPDFISEKTNSNTAWMRN